MVKYYANFLYPGTIVAEEAATEISTSELNINDIPKYCEAFRTFQILETVDNGITMRSDRLYQTDWTYIGKKYTAEEIMNKFPNKRILHNNIKSNKYKYLVETRCRNIYPIKKETKVIDNWQELE